MMKPKQPEEWICFKCDNINPTLKHWRKRKESLRKCLKCGAKRMPVAR